MSAEPSEAAAPSEAPEAPEAPAEPSPFFLYDIEQDRRHDLCFDKNTVGRCATEFDDPTFVNLNNNHSALSRMHATITIAPNGDAWLEDRASTNGTMLSVQPGVGITLEPKRFYFLPVNATVTLGDVLLRFCVDEENAKELGLVLNAALPLPAAADPHRPSGPRNPANTTSNGGASPAVVDTPAVAVGGRQKSSAIASVIRNSVHDSGVHRAEELADAAFAQQLPPSRQETTHTASTKGASSHPPAASYGGKAAPPQDTIAKARSSIEDRDVALSGVAFSAAGQDGVSARSSVADNVGVMTEADRAAAERMNGGQHGKVAAATTSSKTSAMAFLDDDDADSVNAPPPPNTNKTNNGRSATAAVREGKKAPSKKEKAADAPAESKSKPAAKAKKVAGKKRGRKSGASDDDEDDASASVCSSSSAESEDDSECSSDDDDTKKPRRGKNSKAKPTAKQAAKGKDAKKKASPAAEESPAKAEPKTAKVTKTTTGDASPTVVPTRSSSSNVKPKGQRMPTLTEVQSHLVVYRWPEEQPLVACLTGMDAVEKGKITNRIQLMGGVVQDDWNRKVTLLVVKDSPAARTPKFLMALANGVPIVTAKFFTDANPNHASNGLPLSKVHEYIPELTFAASSTGASTEPVVVPAVAVADAIAYALFLRSSKFITGSGVLSPWTFSVLDVQPKPRATLADIITSSGGQLMKNKRDQARFEADGTVVVTIPHDAVDKLYEAIVFGTVPEVVASFAPKK